MADSMDITFLGTSSAQPNPSRSHSSLALRIDGKIWMFDAGEGTQHRLIQNNCWMNPETHKTLKEKGFAMHASSLKFGKIEKFFITHMHGDHIFGLPGALCTISQNVGNSQETNAATEDTHDCEKRIDHESSEKMGKELTKSLSRLSVQDKPNEKIIQIYGPATLRRYLRQVLLFSSSGLGCKYQVHELLTQNDPIELNNFSSITDPNQHKDELHKDEIFGENIMINEKGYWDLFVEDGMIIKAAPILHAVPCIGYVIQEEDSPGKLHIDKLNPVLEKHKQLIIQEMKIAQPKSLCAKIKNGQDIVLPNGEKISASDYVSPPRKGRKIVILGDTFDPSGIAEIAMDADCLVHEATNAFLSPESIQKYSGKYEHLISKNETYEKVRENTIAHGHSTPEMAGSFAHRIRAKMLLLNHFSSRYKDDEESEESQVIMNCIRQCAVSTFKNENVLCARDFMCVYLPKKS